MSDSLQSGTVPALDGGAYLREHPWGFRHENVRDLLHQVDIPTHLIEQSGSIERRRNTTRQALGGFERESKIIEYVRQVLGGDGLGNIVVHSGLETPFTIAFH